MFKVIDGELCANTEGVYKPVLKIERYDAGGGCSSLIPSIDEGLVVLSSEDDGSLASASPIEADGTVYLKAPGGFSHNILV